MDVSRSVTEAIEVLAELPAPGNVDPELHAMSTSTSAAAAANNLIPSTVTGTRVMREPTKVAMTGVCEPPGVMVR